MEWESRRNAQGSEERGRNAERRAAGGEGKWRTAGGRVEEKKKESQERIKCRAGTCEKEKVGRVEEGVTREGGAAE